MSWEVYWKLFIKEHCSAKKELNISAFTLNLLHTSFGSLKMEYKEFFYYSKISSSLTNRISCWSFHQLPFLIRRSNIFVYYFPSLNLIGIKENNVISTNPFVLLATRFAYYPVRIIKPFYYVQNFYFYKHISFTYH